MKNNRDILYPDNSIDKYNNFSTQCLDDSKYLKRKYSDIHSSKVYKYLIFDFGLINTDLHFKDNKM